MDSAGGGGASDRVRSTRVPDPTPAPVTSAAGAVAAAWLAARAGGLTGSAAQAEPAARAKASAAVRRIVGFDLLPIIMISFHVAMQCHLPGPTAAVPRCRARARPLWRRCRRHARRPLHRSVRLRIPGGTGRDEKEARIQTPVFSSLLLLSLGRLSPRLASPHGENYYCCRVL